MTYDVLKLCVDKGDHYEVDPAVMFPATIARIQEVLDGAPPTEIVSKGWDGNPFREPVADRFLKEIEALPREALDSRSPEVLALAESWFKRAIALKVGHGLRIHILKNLDYRRTPAETQAKAGR